MGVGVWVGVCVAVGEGDGWGCGEQAALMSAAATANAASVLSLRRVVTTALPFVLGLENRPLWDTSRYCAHYS